MITIETTNTFVTGTFPDTLAVNSSGAATPDGFEFIAAYINNSVIGPQQAIIDYAGITPDGVTEAAGTAQILEAITKGWGIGPGKYVQWGLYDDPSVTGDRVILLSEQGVLIASYPDLDAACYVGDANNATVAAAGGKFYRSSDAAGTTPNIAGPYLQLPASPSPQFLKQYSEAAGDFTVTTTNWTTTAAYAIPYKDSSGESFLKLWIRGSLSTAIPNPALNISGILSKNITNYEQAVTVDGYLNAGGSATNYVLRNHIQANSNVLRFTFDGNIDRLMIYAELHLDSWPTWADDFDIPWGITY